VARCCRPRGGQAGIRKAILTGSGTAGLSLRGRKAIEDYRSPRRFALPGAWASALASWSAPALWRFRDQEMSADCSTVAIAPCRDKRGRLRAIRRRAGCRKEVGERQGSGGRFRESLSLRRSAGLETGAPPKTRECARERSRVVVKRRQAIERNQPASAESDSVPTTSGRGCKAGIIHSFAGV
jgi:hypothetical protein